MLIYKTNRNIYSMKMFCEGGSNYYRYLCIVSLVPYLHKLFLPITVMFFYSYCFLGTLDRFPGGDRMKAFHFFGIFMFAFR